MTPGVTSGDSGAWRWRTSAAPVCSRWLSSGTEFRRSAPRFPQTAWEGSPPPFSWSNPSPPDSAHTSPCRLSLSGTNDRGDPLSTRTDTDVHTPRPRPLTGHQHDGLFVWVELHLSGDPRPVEVGVPPTLLLVLGVFVLVSRPDERDAEIALLPVHGHLLMLRRRRGSWVLFGCSETRGSGVDQSVSWRQTWSNRGAPPAGAEQNDQPRHWTPDAVDVSDHHSSYWLESRQC